jgi:hypothetical protein
MNEVMYIVVETPQEIQEKVKLAFRSFLDDIKGE